MAQARKYNKYIEIVKSTNVADGFGGQTVSYDSYANMWANVTAKSASSTNENGITNNSVQTIFTIRQNPNVTISVKDCFIYYANHVYSIDSVLNVNLDNVDIEIQATQKDGN
jgi:head-tail adaptor